MKPLSAQQKKRANVKALVDWYKAVGHDGIREYIRNNMLNRTLIAKELAFSRSTWGSNDRLAKALRGIEGRLRSAGLFDDESGSGKASNKLPVRDRQAAQRSRDSQRLKSMEQKNANMQAKLDEAHAKLKELKVFEEFLAETGRSPH